MNMMLIPMADSDKLPELIDASSDESNGSFHFKHIPGGGKPDSYGMPSD